METRQSLQVNRNHYTNHWLVNTLENCKIKWAIVIGNLKIEKRSRGITNGSKCLKLIKHTEQGTWGWGHLNSCHSWQHRWIKYDRRYDTVIYNWGWIAIMCRD